MLKKLFDDVQIFDFDMQCADKFGWLQAVLLKQGRATPTADLMITSVALVHGLTLVTHNSKDYRFIPDLRLEDWISD